MERKTQITAENGKQDLVITREFDLPLELLFKAYADPEIVAQWMGTNVLKHESRQHGSYQFETTDAQKNVLFRANGVFHEFSLNQKIIRTFEMENAPFGPQLEFLEFESLADGKSKFTMQIVYRSGELRDQMLQLPFAHGLNMAHNRLEEIVNKLN